MNSAALGVALSTLLLVTPPDATKISSSTLIRTQVWTLIDESYLDRSFGGQSWKEERWLPQPSSAAYYSEAEDRKEAERLVRSLGDRYTRVYSPKEAEQLAKLERDIAAAGQSNVVEAIQVPTSSSSNLGYLRLSSFTAAAPASVEAALEQFRANSQLDGVVLDLRGNGGGSLEACLTIAGMLLPAAGGEAPPLVVQYTSDASGCAPRVSDFARAPLWTGPLEVWIDGQTASAAEALAGALRDHGRATLVGSSSTFGKGTVQRVFPLQRVSTGGVTTASGEEDLAGGLAGSLKMTIAASATPAGTPLSKGLAPDEQRLLASSVLGRGPIWLGVDARRARFAPPPPSRVLLAQAAAKATTTSCPDGVLQARDDWRGRDAPLWTGAAAPALAAVWGAVVLAAVRAGGQQEAEPPLREE